MKAFSRLLKPKIVQMNSFNSQGLKSLRKRIFGYLKNNFISNRIVVITGIIVFLYADLLVNSRNVWNFIMDRLCVNFDSHCSF